MFLQTSPNCVQSRPGIPYGHIFKQMHSRYLWEVSAKRQQLSYPLSSCKDCRMGVFASAASHNMQEFSLPLYSCPCRNSRGACSYCLHLEKTLLISYPTANSKLYSHTHIFPSPICVLCPKVPGQVGKGGHTSGFDRVDVVYSRGFSRRPLPEVQTGATNITKCTEWFQCLK